MAETPALDQYRSCPSHCCPKHGCKYAKPGCPVANGTVTPEYPPDNGCELCEFVAEQRAEIVADGATVDAETLAKWLVDNGYAEAKAGYGHVSGEDLAEALLARFMIVENT